MRVIFYSIQVQLIAFFIQNLFFSCQSEPINIIKEFITDEMDDNNQDAMDDNKNIQNWIIIKNSYGTQNFSVCGKQKGRKIVGGYQIFTGLSYEDWRGTFIQPTKAIRKFIQPIIPYWSFEVSVKIFKIDSWNDEKMIIWINQNFYEEINFDACYDQVDLCGSKIPPGPDDNNFNYAYNDGIKVFKYNSTTDKIKFNKFESISLISYHDAEENESWGFREFYVNIDSCHPSCKTCNGPAYNQCLTCFSDSTLFQKVCVCSQNTFKMQLKNINACYKDENSFNNCQLCVNSCQVGQYQRQLLPGISGIVCEQCDMNCKSCDSSSTNCLSCYDSFFLVQDKNKKRICKKCHESCQTCLTYQVCNNCSNGYYSISLTSEQTCFKCDSQCSKCVLRADNCLECSLGFNLVTYKGQTFCQKCPDNCEECIFDYIEQKSTCKKCIQGTFYQPTKQVCLKDPKDCGNQLYGLDSERQCVNNCKEGYYLDKELNKCMQCHPFCQACFNKYETHCIQCKEGYLKDGMTCTPSCIKQDKISDTINGDCNYYFPKKVTLSGKQITCNIACQQGTVYDLDSYGCVPCKNNCYNCKIKVVGYVKQQECIECQYPYFLNNGSCQTKCPNGNFKDPINLKCSTDCPAGYHQGKDQECLQCSQGCQQCNDKSSCQKCFENWTLEGSSTQQCKCGDGYSTNQNIDKCVKCKDNCNKCDPITLQCIECDINSGLQIDPKTNQCTICKLGFKQNGEKKCEQCLPKDYQESKCLCLDKCEACENSTECSTCKNSDSNLDKKTCECLTGYSQIEPGKECIKCSNGCLKCKSAEICIACGTDLYLNSKFECVQNCTDTYYPDNINKVCSLECPSGSYKTKNQNINTCLKCKSETCKLCTDEDNCTVCQDMFFRRSKDKKIICEKTCPETHFPQYDPIKECVLCSSTNINCLNCSQDGKMCTQCSENFHLEKGKCQPCIINCKQCGDSSTCKQCIDGYYVNSSNLCVKCKENCSKCDDITGKCNDCFQGFEIKQENCVQNCQSGEFLKEGEILCSKCHFSCQSCTGSNTNCTACSAGFNIQTPGVCQSTESTRCKENTPNCKTCLMDKCQECNQYHEKDGELCNLITCADIKCKFCSNNQDCQECKNNYKLVGNKCECETGYFIQSNDTIGECQKCNKECKQCVDSASKCISCPDGFEYFKESYQCFPICEQGQYRSNPNQNCQECNPTCKTCAQNKDQCTSCYYGFNSDGNECIEQCRVGFFRDSNKKCIKCSDNCLQCDKYDFCTLCAPKFELIQLSSPSQIQYCQEECQDGYFFPKQSQPGIEFKDQNISCQKCDQNCLKCKESSDKCEVCAQNFEMININNEKKCKQICKDEGTEIGIQSSLFCEKCDQNCLTCSKNNIKNCKTCNEGFTKKTDKFNNEFCEQQQCKEGEYLDSPYCQICDSSCKTCKSQEECNECNEGFKKIENNKCIPVCKPNQFLTNDNKCKNCSEQVCNGCIDNPYKCTSCLPGYQFDNGTSSCKIEKCLDGSYLFESNLEKDESDFPIPENIKLYKCLTCDSPCKTCQETGTKCTSCSPQFELIENKCYPDCQKDEYRDINKQCQICDSNCKSCKNNSNSCTSCVDNMEVDHEENKCINKCKDNEFRNKEKQCLLCESACKKCIDEKTKCTECQSDEDLIDNKCYKKCKPIGEFRNKNLACSLCDQNCKKCSEQANKCTECHDNYELSLKNPLFQKTECIPICQDNQFINSQKQCELCSEDCLTCESIANKCLSCKDGFEYDDMLFKCDEIILSYSEFSFSGFFFLCLVSLTLIIFQQIFNSKNVYGLYTLQLVQMLGSYISHFKIFQPKLANDYFSPMYKFNISPFIPFNKINSIDENLNTRYFMNILFQNNIIFHTVLILILFGIAVIYRNWTKQYGKLYIKVLSASSNLYIYSACYQIKYGTFDSSNGFSIWNYIFMSIILVGYIASFFYIFYKQLYLLYSEIENKYFYHYLEARKILVNILIVFLPLKYCFSVLIIHLFVSIVFIKSNPLTLPGYLKNLVRFTEIQYLITNVIIIIHSNVQNTQSEIALISYLIIFQSFIIIVFIAQLVRSYLIKRSKDNQNELENLLQFKVNTKDRSFLNGTQNIELINKSVSWTNNPMATNVRKSLSTSPFLRTSRRKENTTISNNLEGQSPLTKPTKKEDTIPEIEDL